MEPSAIPHRGFREALFCFLLLAIAAPPACPAGTVQELGNHLYAYISANNHSSNSAFLIGSNGIFVVDTGLNPGEGSKLLSQIQKVSRLPVRYILTTHYHPDHQGANGLWPDATIISTEFTRARTLQLIAAEVKNRPAAPSPSDLSMRSLPQFRAAALTFTGKITLYTGKVSVEIYAAGAAHTGGDAFAYFPRQGVVATGDLYITNSCPDIDHGNVAHWVQVLDFILSLPASHFVPGAFRSWFTSTSSAVPRLSCGPLRPSAANVQIGRNARRSAAWRAYGEVRRLSAVSKVWGYFCG